MRRNTRSPSNILYFQTTPSSMPYLNFHSQLGFPVMNCIFWSWVFSVIISWAPLCTCEYLWQIVTRCYTLLHIYSDDLLNRYEQTLRPESLRNGGRHLLSESKLATFWRRLETRLCSLKAEESMFTITLAMASHIHAMHVKKEISRKLTGDRTKILMLTMPFICRDLAYEEVWCWLLHKLLHTITLYYTES